VRSSKVVRRIPTESNGTPEIDLGFHTHTQFFLVFFGCYAATQLALQLHQERTQVVCSNREARKRPSPRHSSGPCLFWHQEVGRMIFPDTDDETCQRFEDPPPLPHNFTRKDVFWRYWQYQNSNIWRQNSNILLQNGAKFTYQEKNSKCFKLCTTKLLPLCMKDF